MNSSLKQKVPLLFLIGISVWWAFYYQSNGPLNDFGRANFEWLFLVDGLLVLPILCLLCSKDKKEAAMKILLYSSIIVFVGSLIIPTASKVIWPYLESSRYLILSAFVVVEVTIVMTIVVAIRAAFDRNADPDLAISSSIKRFLGQGLLFDYICLEARVWSYALFSKAIKMENFSGREHFTYHRKDDAQGSSMGFILLILFEAPLMHLVLHFLWSPMAANFITGLTLFGLVFLFAENRAMDRRPISLEDDKIVIRYGVFKPKEILLSNIALIRGNNESIPRSKLVKRFDFSGHPNVVIDLIEPDGHIEKIYLGVDSPKMFIDAANEARGVSLSC